ncbi:MAG: hypothetical protein ABDI20_02365 [Candidatus Bipolaricaulaceae bacterium]
MDFLTHDTDCMSRLTDIVWQLYKARENFNTLQIEFRWALEHAAELPPQAARLMLRTFLWGRRPGGKGGSPGGFRQQKHTWTERIYIEKPARWRSESIAEGRGPSIRVIDGTRRWILTPNNEFHTNELPAGLDVPVRREPGSLGSPSTLAEALADHPCLDPSFILCFFSLEPVGEDSWAGRAALRVRAFPRNGRKLFESMFYDADEVEFWMDKERGVILRYQTKAKRGLFGVIEALRVVFDQPIPEDLFVPPRNFRGPVHLYPS